MPQSLKHPQRPLDQPRLPFESKGKPLGLVWEATCIPACPCKNCQRCHDEANREEQTLGWVSLAIVCGSG